jgi:hypothetical protein
MVRKAKSKMGVSMSFFIDNLSQGEIEDDLRRTFQTSAQVKCTKIILVTFGNELRGFGFVDMSAEAQN